MELTITILGSTLVGLSIMQIAQEAITGKYRYTIPAIICLVIGLVLAFSVIG